MRNNIPEIDTGTGGDQGLDPTVDTNVDVFKRIYAWILSQQKRAKVAWVLVVGLCAYLGYDLTLTPRAPSPTNSTDGITIRVSGEILEIEGHRVTKLDYGDESDE
jgi:hypothetical protein